MSAGHRSVIVTGAAGGIGAETVQRLLADGWSVVAVDRVPAGEQDGVRVVVGDVTAESTWAEAHSAADDVAPLTAVVNGAGVQGTAHRFAETPIDELRRVLAINVESAFLGTRLGLSQLGDGGAIVNLASTAGRRGVPRYAAYSAAKHAVIGLTLTAALEGGRAGIRVNALCPGPTDTPMIESVAAAVDPNDPIGGRARLERANPMRRFGKPEEIAESIRWLVSPAASYVNGSVLTIDGGLTAS